MSKHKIFLSSVQKEFQAERQAIKDFINSDPLCRRCFDVFLFEDISARDRNPDSVYLAEVGKCDLYVGLLGDEYGKEDAQGISATEHEFQEATRLGKTRLVFIKSGAETNRHPKIVKLVHKAGGEMIRRKFSNIPELVTQVYAALVQYMEDSGVLQTVPFDTAVCLGAAFSDVDEATIGNFLETARSERKFPLGPNTEPKKLFAHLNLLNGDKLSHAAVLLFCRTPQKFRALICAEVKCLHFHGVEVRKPVPSYQIYKGTLFEQVDDGLDFVLSKLNRSVAAGKKGSASEVAYEIPKPVIREAIVNAVAHRDYTSNASVQVMLFADRLEVWNPGALPAGMTTATLRVEHASVPHNPLISEPLFWAHYIERAGTGTLDMIALCREAGLAEPEFEQRGDQFVLTIRRKQRARQDKPPSQSTDQVTGQVTGQVAGQVTGQLALTILKLCQDPQTAKSIQVVVGIKHRETFLQNYLNPLLTKGWVARTIPDKPNSSLQRYRLTPKGSAYLNTATRKKVQNDKNKP
jgi:ATP-dependent DNA helicase RecG